MQEFQRGLLEDLRGRAAALQTRLDPAAKDVDTQARASDVQRALARIEQTADRMLADPSLARPELNRQHREVYQRLTENLFIIESYLVPPLERFTEHDRRLTRLVKKLGEQINWPLPAPIVVADSSQYYMTFPAFGLMKVPAAEDENMLAYPDLVHEMTHILLTKERGRLLGDFVNVLGDYVAEQQKVPGAAPLPPHLFEQWRSMWLEEFVCDMVAVYATGPAFGAQHIRLISGMPSRAYQYGKSHPPDEARVRSAAAVLRAMGKETDAADVDKLWKDYAPTTGEAKPPDYDRVLPDVLVDALAKRVVAGAQQLGLRAYDAPEASRPDDVVGMVAEGWRRFRANPTTFRTWQPARLRLLWKQLGLDGPAVRDISSTTPPALPPRIDEIGPRLRPTTPLRPLRAGNELAA